MKSDRRNLLATLKTLSSDRSSFTGWAKDRISAFSPTGIETTLEGYLVAGGGSSGFAFGEQSFFLNIAHYSGQPETARLTFTHELYHAVQAVAARSPSTNPHRIFDPGYYNTISNSDARSGYLVNALLTNLLVEGAATYVGDPALITETGPMANFERERFARQMSQLDRIATMLELILIGVTNDPIPDLERVHALAFQGPDQPLYYLGYEMARQIAQRHGASRLAQLTNADGCTFVREYLALELPGCDPVALSPRTVAITDRYCPPVQR